MFSIPDDNEFCNLLSRQCIESKVRERVSAHGGVHDTWFRDSFLPILGRIEIAALSWEQILAGLPDTQERTEFERFYAQCLKFNPLRGKSTA